MTAEPPEAGLDRLPSQTVKAQLALRDLLLDGKLGPGERVSELQMVEQLGVSRTPVRSALARLAEEGLLEAIPTGGYAVRSFSEAEVFAAVEIRGTLEGLAARLAAERVFVPSLWGLDSISGMARAVLDPAPPRFALAGHSLGARVALEVVRQAPERVERLALLDTGVHPMRPGEAEKRQELIDLARREGMAVLAARWLPPMVYPDRGSDPALMGPLTAMVRRATPEIFERQVRALLARPDAAAVLPGIGCPTLVACGRQDAWSPLAQHEEMAAAIPGARLAVIEDSGHMSTVEAPGAVTRLLLDWMRMDAGA